MQGVKIKSNIQKAIQLHLNENLTNKDILRGDRDIFKIAVDNLSPNNKEFLKDKDYFYELLNGYLPANDTYEFISNNDIDKSIVDICNSFSSDFVRNEVLRLSDTPKKMLRGKLCTLESDNYNMAALIELFHLASLIQDDVIDKASIRRHKATIHTLYDKRIAIITADLLLIEILTNVKKEIDFQLGDYDNSPHNKDIAEYVYQQFQLVIEGMLHAEENASHITSMEDYIDYIAGKTANLFGLSCMLGVLKEDSSIDMLQEHFQIGFDFGILFQKVDDVIDEYGHISKTGKNCLDKSNNIINFVYLKNRNRDIIMKEVFADINNLKSISQISGLIDEIEKIMRSLNE